MTYQWVDMGNGRQVYRKVSKSPLAPRSDFPLPQLRRDSIPLVQSMADGNYYDSLSDLRRTYRADGNPQGVEYREVGDEVRTDPVMPKVTKEECAVLLDKYEAAVSRGEIHHPPSSDNGP